MLDRIKESLAVLQLLLGLIPALRGVIEAINVPGFGEKKKELVMQLVSEALDVATALGLPVAKEKILEPVSKFIDFLVTFLHAVGVFKHRDELDPTPTPTQA